MPFVLKNRVQVTSTTTNTGSFALGPAVTGYQDFSVIGNNNTTYYLITLDNSWEVGIGTYSIVGNTLIRNRVLGSSNSGDKVDWPAGTKTVKCVNASIAIQPGILTSDDSQIGTNLLGWNLFQSVFNTGEIGDVTFGNSNINGIVSTYSVLVTTDDGYYGGVLAPNGDIHFVPYAATVGQKINYLTGVVSTYSLVYSIGPGGAGKYFGGVLASNGDIHFVPSNAIRGQKISASGVVSTYSLVYTTTGSGNLYAGGVLAPNGDIHFVPASARVGQKVSAAGVVSTYSLVYTTAAAYSGGVLAPNGDIHFVPARAVVGQKISAAGVVSTYLLAYTTVPAYSGGVLAFNGDIHFVPSNARVGQKVSISGVVSTYSLAITTVNGAYQGGVLAPNGDIYFARRNAGVGQKISLAGVVSTFSQGVASFANTGGVLAPNGDIYFVSSFNSNYGQKISINSGAPFNIGTCLSSYLNKF